MNPKNSKPTVNKFFLTINFLPAFLPVNNFCPAEVGDLRCDFVGR